MVTKAFKEDNLRTVSEALDIAEDRAGNYYKFSLQQWKRHRYEVKTQTSLSDQEIANFGFALLNKYTRITNGNDLKTKKRDFYFICLQDHQIIKAMTRDHNLQLLPLLIYIFTHELVHIIRFCNFSQRYEIAGEGKEKEEKVVHTTTYDILRNLSLPYLDYILEAYRGHRICSMVAS